MLNLNDKVLIKEGGIAFDIGLVKEIEGIIIGLDKGTLQPYLVAFKKEDIKNNTFDDLSIFYNYLSPLKERLGWANETISNIEGFLRDEDEYLALWIDEKKILKKLLTN